MAASATPWSKATVSQAVTQPDPVCRVEAPPEPPQPTRKQPGAVAELVAWIGVGVMGVLLVVFMQDLSWSGSPAAGPVPARSVKASNPAGRLAGGIAVGAVVDNDGRTLRVRGLTGGTTTVHTDAATSTHVVPGSKVSDIGSGSMIMVYGAEQADGSVDARLIVGLAMPG